MVEARYAVKGETCSRRRRSFYCNTEGEFGYFELWREKRLMETAVFGKKRYANWRENIIDGLKTNVMILLTLFGK